MSTEPEYSARIREHFRAPRNAGSFPRELAVLCGRAGARRHGREVMFQLRLASDGRIRECRYRVYGCPATIALCSIASEALQGRPLAEAAAYSVLALADELGLPAEKRDAALTIEDAIRSAVRRYNAPQRPQSAVTQVQQV
ncbi:MAG: iron-sulfur cluster assembly scaffold protein [Gammaproteobacteria bacterium]